MLYYRDWLVPDFLGWAIASPLECLGKTITLISRPVKTQLQKGNFTLNSSTKLVFSEVTNSPALQVHFWTEQMKVLEYGST
ncbi:hypothetical protein OB13_19835 [Pontibacter sp. HJ8]